jgi:chromosome segregation ATPase
MTNGQFEHHMQFIVEQQAQFTVDIQQLNEAQAELTTKHNHLTEALTTVVGMVGKLTQAQNRTDDKLAQAQDRTDEKLLELTNKQAETDDRLNTLIGVVERYFSGNGASSRKRRAKSGGERKPKKGIRR